MTDYIKPYERLGLSKWKYWKRLQSRNISFGLSPNDKPVMATRWDEYPMLLSPQVD